jgi:hypothetical protein
MRPKWTGGSKSTRPPPVAEDDGKGKLLELYCNNSIIGKVDKGIKARLRRVVKDEVFPKMKFLPHEGNSLQTQALIRDKFPSLKFPDLRKRSGCAYTILKSVGMYEKGYTIEDRVRYWKTYHKEIQRLIMTERSIKTEALKECVIQGA